MGNPESRDHLDHRDCLAQLDHPETADSQENPVRMENPASQERPDREEIPERMAHQESRAPRDHRALTERGVLRDPEDRVASRDCRVLLEILEHQGRTERPGHRVLPDFQDPPDLEATGDSLESAVLWDHRDHLASGARRASRDPTVSRDHQDLRVTKDILVLAD